MIRGIVSPETDHVAIENLPEAGELMRIEWTKLSSVVMALRHRLEGTGLEVTASTVLEAYKTLCGERMLWISSQEHCIYADSLPTDMRAEILLPDEYADQLRTIFVTKALIRKLETDRATTTIG